MPPLNARPSEHRGPNPDSRSEALEKGHVAGGGGGGIPLGHTPLGSRPRRELAPGPVAFPTPQRDPPRLEKPLPLYSADHTVRV